MYFYFSKSVYLNQNYDRFFANYCMQVSLPSNFNYCRRGHKAPDKLVFCINKPGYNMHT